METQVNTLAAVQGSVEFTAIKRDGSTELVSIRQLTAREYPKYLDVQANEPEAVEMVCGKPAGWSDGLTPESFSALVVESEKVNAGFFGWRLRWFERQERVNPGITQVWLNHAASLLQSSSPNSQQAPK